MSNTPRTDALRDRILCLSEHDYNHFEIMVEHAELLELALSDSKAQLIQLRKDVQASFEFQDEARRQFRDGTWHGNTTKDYRDSIAVGPNEPTAFLSLAYQWQDKKHRHVFDLCDWIDQLQDEIKKLKENHE